MRNHPSLYAFLNGLIDYAGLFPPANLDLKTAIKNYAQYIHSIDSWMLGPFVIPITKLNELSQYSKLFSSGIPLKLSVVGRKSETNNEFLVQFHEDMEQIRIYHQTFSEWSQIETIEIHLPHQVPSQELLKVLTLSTEKQGVNLFCEVSILGETNWKAHLINTLDVIAQFNEKKNKQIGIKLRTGGIKKEMIPPLDRIAFAMAAVRDRKLPMKFTAGLHHPIRMYREEVQDKMHGFLNIFLSGMLAYQENLDEKSIKHVLSEEESRHFIIQENELGWRNFHLTSSSVQELRKRYLCSFGSCSFDEPRDELLELIQKEGVMK